MSIGWIGFRGAVKVHRCTDGRISRKKSHLVSPFEPLGAAFMRDLAIHMSFHHREIGGVGYPGMTTRIAVAQVWRKVSPRFGVMFTMAGSWHLPVNGWQLAVTI
jgi:hypothetical protein